MSPSHDLAAALGGLPHGPGFRFLDALTRLSPGRSGSGTYRLRGDEAFLPGHFPGDPMMPGVLLIEAIAQLGGVVAQSDPARSRLAGLRLSAVRSAKILEAVRPGETIEVQAEIEGRLDGLVQVAGCVRRDGRILASAKVVLSGDERPASG
jgi:3-hydroxyacyl-[acyl-carrier-protein] dehydratase